MSIPLSSPQLPLLLLILWDLLLFLPFRRVRALAFLGHYPLLFWALIWGGLPQAPVRIGGVELNALLTVKALTALGIVLILLSAQGHPSPHPEGEDLRRQLEWRRLRRRLQPRLRPARTEGQPRVPILGGTALTLLVALGLVQTLPFPDPFLARGLWAWPVALGWILFLLGEDLTAVGYGLAVLWSGLDAFHTLLSGQVGLLALALLSGLQLLLAFSWGLLLQTVHGAFGTQSLSRLLRGREEGS